MSIHFCISVVLLASAFILSVDSQSAIQEYVIRKDLVSGLKAGEFSVYDKNEKQLYYRIESKYSLMHNIEIYAYASHHAVGRLQSKINFVLYKAEFSILDPQSNKWAKGSILQNFQWFGNTFNIDYNGQRIIMEIKIGSLTWKFRDTDGKVLAQFRIRVGSMFWKNKYDMQIFSTKFPEQIYLLALATRDYKGRQ